MANKTKLKSNKPVRNNLLVMLSILVIILFYTWLAGSGASNQQGTTTQYYAQLADAFTNGNLYLTGVEKDIPIDLSYYEGKFYLYWGPVPAIILAFLHIFFREPVRDFFVAFGFGVGILLAQSMLLLAIWNRHFNSLPKWMLHLSIFAGGLLEPIIFLRHNHDYARIYQAAIGGGQFFLLCGLLLAFTAITRPSIPNWRLTLAGLSWVLAIGTRHILAAPIGFMVLLMMVWLIKTNNKLATKIAKLIFLGLPLVAGAIALGWYNWARFDSITETGFSYALAGENIQEHADEIFSDSYIIHNLYNFTLNPPGTTLSFPFLFIRNGMETPILSIFTAPAFYHPEPMTGLLYIFPLAVFAVIPLVTLSIQMFREKSAKSLWENDNHWIAFNLTGSVLIALALLTGFFWVSMRYLGDFIPSLAVLGALGFWQSQSLARKDLYTPTGFILASVSILVNTLLAISTTTGG